jgi:hypothetical protein
MQNEIDDIETIKSSLSEPPKKKRRLPRRRRRGLSPLTEGLLYLLAAVIVVASLLGLYFGVTGSLNRTALQSQLTRAVAAIDRAHSYSGTFANASLLIHLEGEGFSGRELSTNSSGAYVFTSPYGTDITIVGDGARSFTVTANDLTSSACRTAALSFQDTTSGLDSLTIETASITLPMTESAVATACNNNTNDVVLTF